MFNYRLIIVINNVSTSFKSYPDLQTALNAARSLWSFFALNGVTIDEISVEPEEITLH